MKILSIFSSFTGRKKGPGVRIDTSSTAAVDEIFAHILKLLTKPESVKDIFSKYDEVRRLPHQQREQSFIQVYLNLESFITESKPIITKSAYTVESLRKEISENVPLEGLGSFFRLVFLPETEQAIVLYSLGMREILSFIESHMAGKDVQQQLAQASKETLLSGIPFTTASVSEDAMLSKCAKSTLPQIISAFRALYGACSSEITRAFGEKTANEVFGAVYNFVKTTYSFDLVGLYMDVLPRQLFESERLGMLSREELERNVIMRTRQLSASKALIEEKLAEIEAKNRELEQTKLAVLNVLDDEKRLRRQLLLERDQAEAILRSMGEGLYVVGKNCTIITLNESAQNMLTVDAKDVVGRQWNGIIEYVKNSVAIPANQWPETVTLTQGIPVNVGLDDAMSLRKGNGDEFPVSVKTTPLISDGEVIGAVVVFADITRERKEKEIIEETVAIRTRQLREKTSDLESANVQIKAGWEALAKEKAKLTSSINSLSLGFIMTDTQGSILMINPAALFILGIDNSVKNLQKIDAKLGKNNYLTHEHESCHQDQKPIHIKELTFGTKFLSIFLAPIISMDLKEDIGTVILVEDITERKIIERSKDEFFSIASHELRTPLTAIRGNTSLIKQYFMDKIDPQVRDMILDIHESSVRLIGIVNDFLNLSRLETGKIQFAKEVFDMPALIENVIKEMTAQYGEKKLTLALLTPPANLPSAFADQNRTKEILINLLGNAFKFTTKGGVTIELVSQASQLKVLISDTGRGIAPANQGLLFRKFQQAGSSLITRDTAKGTGLGLYISKLMVEGMEGKIWLEKTEEDKGTTFAFTLPIAPAAALESKTTPPKVATTMPLDAKTIPATTLTAASTNQKTKDTLLTALTDTPAPTTPSSKSFPR